MTDDTEARWNAETAPAGAPGKPAAPSVFDGAERRFDELSELGRGGMGRVAEARDRVLDRTVAIKHMLATDGVGLARFEREVRITARLQHPGIVPILDAGRDDDGHPYYVMRKIDGVALADRVAKRSVRDRLALVPAMLAAVDAVAYAHAQGIVHRDIKPWNILLGAFGETLMIDWGLARDLDAQPITEPPERSSGGDAALTRLGSAYGTPGFMSPEQARGEPADRRADVYSLGATLYFVLAGVTPFAGAEPTEVIDKVAAGTTPDLAKIPPEVPAELVAIVTKALGASPDARYPDAGELADDLRRFLAGQLVAAHRYTPWERVTKWVRKHRLVTAISVAAIAVIAIGGVWSISRIVTERDHARDAQSLAETRADDLVVDRARSLVQTDPTSAVAVLRGLPASSPQWPVAREIVRAAMAGGIERIVAHLSNRVTAIAFSPHGRLASAALENSNGHGEIRIHDLARGTSTTVANVGVGHLAWLDEHTLAGWELQSGGPGVLEVIDTDSARITPIAIAGFTTVAVDSGRAIVRRADGSVVSFGVDGVLTVLADSGVDTVDAAAGRIVMVDRKHMTIIDRDGTRRERALDIPKRIFHVRLSHSGKRVAIHAYRIVYEWVVDSDDPPLTWPRTTDAENHVLYVGDQLFWWSGDGTGVAELHADGVLTRWLTEPSGSIGVEPTATAAATTLFVTESGRIAYASELGVVELPHRPEGVARVAYDESARRLAIGTDAGDVEIVDLSSAIPETRKLVQGARVFAIGNERLVFGHETTDATNVNSLDRLEIVELDTNRHHWLPPLGEFADVAIQNNAIVAIGGPGSNMSVVVTDLDGKEIFRANHVGSTEHLSHVAFVSASGDVVELDDAWRPHVIAHLTDAGMYALHETAAGVVATKMVTPIEASVIDASGMHPLTLPLHEPPNSFYTAADGTWWVVENYTHLWRVPLHGTATEIPLPENIRQLKEFGDHVYANGKSKIFEMSLDGTLIRSTSSVGLVAYFDTGYTLMTGEAVVAVMPSANVRRVLHLPRRPNKVVVSHVDARIIAASIPGPDDNGDIVAIWRDPVPVNPAEIPAYIERLTNAHLDPGSDELRWDAP